MADMKAVRLHGFGGPDKLAIEQTPLPHPEDDEVLVRVQAASVNPVDYKTREGKFPPVTQDSLPTTLGRDLAGTVETCGTRAHNMIAKGDRVFAFIGTDRGSCAEFVVVKAIEMVAVPDEIDPVQAAAAPLAALTAWQGMFDHGGLEAGQRVLIHGGAGGVGHFAIQLAKARGATVVTTASGDDLDFVRELGADIAIDYKTERFEDVAKDIDLVFDLVGGETQERSWSVLKQGGIMVSTVQEPDQTKAAGHKARSAPRYMAEPNAAQLGEIADLMAAGKVRAIVSETFPIDDVRAAQERLEKGGVRGKIVLTVG